MFALGLDMLALLGLVLRHGCASEDVSQRIWSFAPIRWALLTLRPIDHRLGFFAL